MTPFLDRYFDEVDDCLNDPHSQKRLTRDQRYRTLCTIQNSIFERLLNLSGQESSIGLTESTITIVDGQTYYALPPRFRQFLKFEKWLNGDRNYVEMYLTSVHGLQQSVGVEILSQQSGMRIHPKPTSAWAGDWVMTYRAGPAKLCRGAVDDINEDGDEVSAEEPGADQGELVLLDDYYAGSVLHVYEATSGAPQKRVIEHSEWDSDNELMIFTLRTPLSPVPTGSALYEICPDLPEGLDSIYAMDCAIMNSGRRTGINRRTGLMADRAELWQACTNYYMNNVADRAPSRVVPPRYDDIDPYD